MARYVAGSGMITGDWKPSAKPSTPADNSWSRTPPAPAYTRQPTQMYPGGSPTFNEAYNPDGNTMYATGWNAQPALPQYARQPAAPQYTRQPAPTYNAGPDTSGGTMYATGWNTQPGYSTQPVQDTSGGTMYATAQPAQPATGQPPAFDWRKGAWEVANRWAPSWAQANPWSNITDSKQVLDMLAKYKPEMKTPAYAQYNADLTYLKGGPANSAMPSWYGVKQPWSETPNTPTPVPGVNYTPAPGVPQYDWSKWGGNTAAPGTPQQFAGLPSWMNDPNWITNPALVGQAEKWAAVMVPWAQTMQNAYQYANDANEAQRRYNLDLAWRQAQDQFTMAQAQQTADYQKVRDQEEFALGRQQIWGRNQTPNVRWQRNWG